MNQINPKKLLHSKWTKVAVLNKEKHFMIIEVEFNERQKVSHCVIQAVKTRNEYEINWRELKSNQHWLLGWQ